MAYQSFPYLGFGRGLNLRDKPDAVDQQECIDALNVNFSERGAIVTRGGYQERVAQTIKGIGSYVNSSGTRRLLTVVGTNLKAYSTAGSEIATSALTGGTPEGFVWARIGTPGTELSYGTNGTDVRSFNGSAFSSPSGMPKATSYAVQTTDNRLVAAGFTGATDGPASGVSSPSHVYFSDPGDPETWGANNFVQLTPGDGEEILGAISWRELLFVFKQSKFFVFYGNSVDAGGDPIFNYRPVTANSGLVGKYGLTTSNDGVYFVAHDGLYRTTGSTPERVSDLVSPLWDGDASPYYTGGVINEKADCCLTAADERIYMAFGATEGQRVLVYDPPGQWFSLYDLPAKYVHYIEPTTDQPGLWFGNTALNEHRTAYADDDGTAPTAKWRSGWVDLGSPDVKVLRAAKLWGKGFVHTAIAPDFSEDVGLLEGVNFQTTAQPQWNADGGEQWDESEWAAPRGLITKQRRTAVRGTVFSTYVVGSAPWALHRLDHLVRQVRQPGIEKS